MSWLDDIEAGLPAPEQNEPPALRQDIVDELSDHLQCALNRELLNHPNEDDAESRVLVRFGPSPQKLARQLWLDAMKEALMSNRLTLTFAAVLTTVCLTLCGMMWTQSQQLRAFADQARAETHALMQQRDEANQKLLDQNRELLNKLSELEKQPAATPGWNPLKVRVILDGEEQTPGSGFAVEVNGKALSESEEIGLHEKTDADGVASFGVVRPGQYRIRVTAPWGESEDLYTVVRPGTEPTVEVTAPRQAPVATPIQPRIEWPKSLQGLDVAAVCRLQRSDATQVNDRWWADGRARYLLIRQDGTMAEYQSIHEERNSFTATRQTLLDTPLASSLTFYTDPVPLDGELAWLGASAELTSLQLVQLAPQAAFPAARDSLPMISPSPLFAMYSRFQNPSQPRREQPSLLLKFSIDKPDWTISIPEDQSNEAIACLAPSKFADLPPGNVAMGMMTFLQADTDGDAKLSADEAEHSHSSHRIRFSEFPVARDEFVKTYVESRNSPASSGFSRSSTSSRRRPE